MNSLEFPGLLFPLLAAYPIMKKRPEVTLLLWLSFARLILWGFGSQQIRFQMPSYPFISIATAYVALRLIPVTRSRLPWHYLLRILGVAFTAVTLVYQGIHLFERQPVLVIMGLESRRSYLSRVIRDFSAWRYVEEILPADRSVLLLGDGRGYYCPSACIADPDHFRWAAEITALANDSQLGLWFHKRNVRYVLLSLEYLDFLLQHDAHGVLRLALERVFRWRDAGCLEKVYEDDWAWLYRVKCEIDSG
jgi:hypothetical protein